MPPVGIWGSVILSRFLLSGKLNRMRTLPHGYYDCLREIRQTIQSVDGWLTDREIEFLALLAACPTAEGEILEIGSHRGKSTIALARASALVESPSPISVVDPFPVSADTTPDEVGSDSARSLFEKNLREAGVAGRIEINQMLSGELACDWDRPLRLLWIDGDHTYEGAKIDMQGFTPFLVDGGMIACHDILSPFGCTRAFRECVLENPHFGAAGFCGSIGWAKYHADPADAERHAKRKRKLANKLLPLCIDKSFEYVHGLERLSYRIHRWFVPHSRIRPERWLRQVA